MKIIIHSLDELKELAQIVAFGLAPRADGPRIADDTNPYVAALVAAATTDGERIDGRPPALAEPYATDEPRIDEPRIDEPRIDEPRIDEPAEILTLADGDDPKADDMVDVDSRNLPHDERIHASTKAKNADGTWRARRGVNPDLVVQVERELMGELIPRTAGERADQREADETAAVAAVETVLAADVDYPAIIKRAEARALDLSGDHRSLMTAAQGFIADHGHDAFNALRAAAVPDENGVGKAVQLLSPGERRLLEACIAEY